MNTTDLDGPAVRGLMRRLEEERVTAEYWHTLAETYRQRARVRLSPQLTWAERLGWLCAGIGLAIVALWIGGVL